MTRCGRDVPGGHRDTESAERAKRLFLGPVEKDVPEPLCTILAVVNATDVDRSDLDGGCSREVEHRFDSASEDHAGAAVVGVLLHSGCRFTRGCEINVHAWWHAHPVEFLLPFRFRDHVIDEYDESEIERLPPSYHDLTMDQPVIDSEKSYGHSVR